ncbi:MAG: UDP-glucose/GDP-mannose dehydrogenase family protein [Thermoplasmata archaeon]|nr:UDP-glucose/GDP-mannose dehydrogenase family protein [Thermoplasmata archaeon]
MADLAVVGLGPVGLATSIAFATEGHQVVGVEVDAKRLSAVARGDPPFYEEGMKEALQAVQEKGTFDVTDSATEAMRIAQIAFLCVGTPSRPDGSMDDRPIRGATQNIAEDLGAGSPTLVVVKSTVVPGTTERVIRPILEAAGAPFHLGVNPEFLREGQAMAGALHPDRIVLGSDAPETAARLRELYSEADCPIVETDLRTAETIKYATNAFLATKVAFANEMADICSALGVSYEEVMDAASLDPRISPLFLVPGVGFGGSCFPKDVRAFVSASRAVGETPLLLEAVLAQNADQYLRAVDLLQEELGELQGRRIALLGLAFKGGTDDVRESRAVPIARTLQERGSKVVGYDPVANEAFAQVLPEVPLVNSAKEALNGADGCILQADWREFGELTAEDFVKGMKTPVVVDGRRILDPAKMAGVRFRRIG